MERYYLRIIGSSWETRIPLVDIMQGELVVAKILALKRAESRDPLLLEDGDKRKIGFVLPCEVVAVMIQTFSDTQETLQTELLRMQHIYMKKMLDL